ncbi:hypothetical protein cypCar_00040276 [Cyprinus carpio]|nr:hypothetical protein cypCar_00040276 [Cyprinus carpio]
MVVFLFLQMLMPKKNRIAIYELLFKEGVMVAKKDVHLAKHPELADKNVPNLHVMKAMQSLKSCGYVKEQFAWRHFYWYLTNEGIQYLRDFLHLPPEIVLRERDRLVWPVARETEMLIDGLQLHLVQTRRLKLEQVQPQNSSLEVVLAVAEDNSHSSFPHYLYNKGLKFREGFQATS